MNQIAQNSIKLFEGTGLYGLGPLGLEGKSADQAPSIFASFISTTIGIMTVIAIIWFIFTFITGAISIITSGGDKQALEGAKKKITTGVLGLIITIFAIFIIRFIGSIAGLTNILNFQTTFQSLLIK